MLYGDGQLPCYSRPCWWSRARPVRAESRTVSSRRAVSRKKRTTSSPPGLATWLQSAGDPVSGQRPGIHDAQRCRLTPRRAQASLIVSHRGAAMARPSVTRGRRVERVLNLTILARVRVPPRRQPLVRLPPRHPEPAHVAGGEGVDDVPLGHGISMHQVCDTFPWGAAMSLTRR